MTDTTATSIITGPMRLFHCAGGTAFELFQKTVYLIFDAGRRAGHLFARHSSVNVNVLEMGMEVDLMGARFFNRDDKFGLRCSSYILRCQTIYTIRLEELERTSEQIARILSTVVSPPATRSMFVCRRETPGTETTHRLLQYFRDRCREWL